MTPRPAKRLPEGVEHGTPEGYDAGCRTTGCPAGLGVGFSCARAKSAERDDPRYNRLRREGLSVEEIADAMNIAHTTKRPIDQRAERVAAVKAVQLHRTETEAKATKAAKTAATKKTSKNITTPEEAPVATISDLLPDVADKLTQDAVTTAADAEQAKAVEKAERAEKRRTAAARRKAAPADPTPAEQEATEERIIARVEEKHATTDPALDVTAIDLEAAWVGAFEAVQQIADAYHDFAVALRSITQHQAARHIDLRQRVDQIENDIKPARAIATALATINQETAA